MSMKTNGARSYIFLCSPSGAKLPEEIEKGISCAQAHAFNLTRKQFHRDDLIKSSTAPMTWT